MEPNWGKKRKELRLKFAGPNLLNSGRIKLEGGESEFAEVAPQELELGLLTLQQVSQG